MYTFALTMFAVLALLGGLGLVMEVVLDRLVFEPIEEDFTDYGEE